MPEELEVEMREAKFMAVEDGTYSAVVKDIKVQDGKFGKMLKWYFEIINNEEYDEASLTGLSSTELTEKSKLFKWVSAILGITDIPVGEKIKIGKCIGKTCRIIVTTTQSKKDPDKTYSNVLKVLPSKKKSVEAAEEEDEPKSKKKHVEVDDDEDDEPKPKKKHTVEVDDEDDEPKPKKKVVEVDEDDEDEEPKPKKKKAPEVDDDEDDEEEEKPKKKKPAVDEDEDDEDVPF